MMKKIGLFLGTVMILTTTGQLSCSSSKTTQEERAQIVKQQIESRRYRIGVDRMSPMQGPTKQLTSRYALTVKSDTVISYLPYAGRAYSLPYGGGKGLNFESLITDYSLTFDAKGTARISFHTNSENDTFLYNAEVFPNGKSTIRVTSNNRQGVTFYGELEENP
jgi:hypothetical protein